MTVTKEEFRTGYGKLVAKIWSDSNELEKLRKEPEHVLKQFGISVPAKAHVRVVEVVPTGKGSFDEQWEDWEDGEKRGAIDLWIPTKPITMLRQSLPDVATTCTPCCTCT